MRILSDMMRRWKKTSYAVRGALGFGLTWVVAMLVAERIADLLPLATILFIPPKPPDLNSFMRPDFSALIAYGAAGLAGGLALMWGRTTPRVAWATAIAFAAGLATFGADFPPDWRIGSMLENAIVPFPFIRVELVLAFALAGLVGSIGPALDARFRRRHPLIVPIAGAVAFAVGGAVFQAFDALMKWYDFPLLAYAVFAVSLGLGGLLLGRALDWLDGEPAASSTGAETAT